MRRVAKQSHSNIQKKQFRSPRYLQRVLAYWKASIVEHSRLEGVSEAQATSWLEVPSTAFSDATLSKPIVEALAALQASEKPRRPRAPQEAIEVLFSPLRLYLDSSAKKQRYFDVFCVPALLSASGGLSVDSSMLPWIPREYLEPGCRVDAPSVAGVEAEVQFFKRHPPGAYSNLKEYWKYCCQYFQFCTGERLEQFLLAGFRRADTWFVRVYANASRQHSGVLSLIEQVQNGQRSPGMVAELLQERRATRRLYGRSKYQLYTTARKHVGHFSADYPLSPSQRIAIHRFLETPSGEVFCVNGPPGTGKTTVLQDFIASHWVQRAVSAADSPGLLLVCGATNQSVTNVLDAMAAAQSSEQKLSGRWLPGVQSYGTYCASFAKADADPRYQTQRTDGKGFFNTLETAEYVSTAEEYFLARYSEVIEPCKSVTRARKQLQRLLKEEVAMLQAAVTSKLEVSVSDLVLRSLKPLPADVLKDLSSRLDSLDTTSRHQALLLATHYWEARWLEYMRKVLSDTPPDRGSKAQGTTDGNTWAARAMISPVLVSTLSMAYRYFGRNSKENTPVIDVVFLDEAGQIAPEQAIASTVLAKKLVVIGDTTQLRPYTQISRAHDALRLVHHKLLKPKETGAYAELARKGIAVAASSIMELAVSSCRREDGQTIGASLVDHRRSVPEIVAFSNQLAYRGRLRAQRPPLKDRVLPVFAFINVSGRASRVGQSWSHAKEASSVLDFIQKYEEKLLRFYRSKHLESVVTVVTPFAAQVQQLKKTLGPHYPRVTVGTIHSMQGAEAPVVLFSSVYDAKHDRPLMFDRDPRLLNVAVSRAKDSFIVFGAKKHFAQEYFAQAAQGQQEAHGMLSPAKLLGRFLFSSANTEAGIVASVEENEPHG